MTLSQYAGKKDLALSLYADNKKYMYSAVCMYKNLALSQYAGNKNDIITIYR